MVTGVTGIERVRQHYTVASAHCAKWVSLPSAKLELMIRISIGVTSYGALGHVPPLELGHVKKFGSFYDNNKQ